MADHETTSRYRLWVRGRSPSQLRRKRLVVDHPVRTSVVTGVAWGVGTALLGGGLDDDFWARLAAFTAGGVLLFGPAMTWFARRVARDDTAPHDDDPAV